MKDEKPNPLSSRDDAPLDNLAIRLNPHHRQSVRENTIANLDKLQFLRFGDPHHPEKPF